MRTIRTLAALAALAALVGAACTGDDAAGGARSAAPDIELASSLQPLGSCAEMGDWLAEEVAPRVGAYGLDGGAAAVDVAAAMEGDVAVATGDDAAAADARSAAGARAPASATNVQVAGVDEPDIVKTDGDRVLAVAGGRLHLVSASERRVLAAVELPAGLGAADLLLAGDRALVVGTGAQIVEPVAAPGGAQEIAPTVSSTVVAEVDVDGGTLAVGDTYRLDGSYVSARMTGDAVRLVLRSSPADTLPFVTPGNGSQAAIDAAREHNRRVVEDADPEALLPRWRRLDAAGARGDGGALVDCTQVHAPAAYAGFALVTVASLDLGDGLGAGLAGSGAAAVLAEGETVYASAEHLYVAAPRWIDEPPVVPLPGPLPVEPDGSAVDGAPQSAPDVTPDGAPAADELARDVAPDDPDVGSGADDTTPGTDIHRFDITDPARVRYEMSGHVPGLSLNQFSLDEHDGRLRVATTVGDRWGVDGGAATDNLVTVLAPEGGRLTPVGSLSGLGRGETIQSVRFLGDVGYVVTFRQTDPLFTLDLSDPTAPRATGELEMLGFSSYLHPVGDGRLLGVGQDATGDGRTTGTQVALFDVRDPSTPRRLDQVVLPDSSSVAEHDHHAFLWWAADGLAAIPLTSYDDAFEGLVGFTVDPDAGTIVERGRVTHAEHVPAPPERPSPTDADDVLLPYPSPVERAFVIGDRLWTLSQSQLAVTDIATLGETSLVDLG